MEEAEDVVTGSAEESFDVVDVSYPEDVVSSTYVELVVVPKSYPLGVEEDGG